MLGTSFIDALPDMRAALRHARSLTSGPILSWGNSYASALILKVATDNPGQADGVLSFSPSEYFPDRQLIQKAVINLTVPTFITSARSEANNYAAIVSNVPPETPLTTFRPSTVGRHGSSTLWATTTDNKTTWREVEAFLAPFLEISVAPAEIRVTSTELSVNPGDSLQLLERSNDLVTWRGLTVIEELPSSAPIALSTDRQAFYRLFEQAEAITADVFSVTATSSSISVGIRSPETKCEQYAD